MRTDLSNFYWVARSALDPAGPAWQVEVIDTAETLEEAGALGGLTRARVLNVAQAAAEGFTIDRIGAAFAASAAGQAEVLAAQLADMSGRLAAAEGRASDLEAERAALAAARDAALARAADLELALADARALAAALRAAVPSSNLGG